MLMSRSNVVPNHVAAMRLDPTARCSARTSAVTPAHSHVLAPVGVTVAYDGGLFASSAVTYPSSPYTPRHVPCVVVSVPTNVALVGPPPAAGTTVIGIDVVLEAFFVSYAFAVMVYEPAATLLQVT